MAARAREPLPEPGPHSAILEIAAERQRLKAARAGQPRHGGAILSAVIILGTIFTRAATPMPASTIVEAAPISVLAKPIREPPRMPAPSQPLALVAPQPPTLATSDIAQCQAPEGVDLVSVRAQRTRRAIGPAVYTTLDEPQMRQALLAAAKAQFKSLAIYNAAYLGLAYPAGDVPSFYGVCTDVIVRAYRSLGIDLQTLVHVTGVGGADRAIDHRRTETLRKFFALHARSVPVVQRAGTFLPGDIVTYYRPQNRSSTAHMAMVSDRIGPSGQPMIIHNRGWGVQEEDALFVDQMTGHYQFFALKPDLAQRMEAVLSGAGLRPSVMAQSATPTQPVEPVSFVSRQGR
jgi:uncharacterized protein YijF (DUF1287 family)